MTSIHHAHGLLLAKMFEVRLVASATWWQYTDGGDARGGHRAPLSHVCRLHGHCRFFVVLRGMLVMFGCFPMMVYWLFWHGRLVWMVVTVWRKDRTESVHNRSVWRYYLGNYRMLFRHEISAAVHMPGRGGDLCVRHAA